MGRGQCVEVSGSLMVWQGSWGEGLHDIEKQSKIIKTANEQAFPEFWDGEPRGSPYFPRIFAHRMERGKKADAVKLFVRGKSAQ